MKNKQFIVARQLRLLALFFLTVCCGLAAADAVAQTIASVSGMTGKCRWMITGMAPNCTLTISGNGEMEDYESEDLTPWYIFRDDLATLVIRDGVTHIGEQAFGRCVHFRGDLTIPPSVTTIGRYAFYACSGFNGVLTLGHGVRTIGFGAFFYCVGLKGDLTIPSSVTNIEAHAFQYCRGFNGKLTLGKAVTDIGTHAFFGCSGLIGAIRSANVMPPSCAAEAFADTELQAIYVPRGSEGSYRHSRVWRHFTIFSY